MVKGNSVQVDEGEESNRTSLTLLEKVRQNDREGWQRLVSLYGSLVSYWCKQAGLQRADADEIGQEVFLAVSRSIGVYRHDRPGDTFRGWLWVIAQNKIRDRSMPLGGQGLGGGKAPKQLALIPSPEVASDGGFDAQEKAILYRRAIAMVESSFETTTRRAFWLVIAGWRAGDVATELAISVAAVYIAKSRVLSRLREEFEGLVDWTGPNMVGTETVVK